MSRSSNGAKMYVAFTAAIGLLLSLIHPAQASEYAWEPSEKIADLPVRQLSGWDDRLAAAYVDFSEANSYSGDNTEIFVGVSTNGGEQWSTPINVSRNSTRDQEPAIAVGPTAVVVAWAREDFSCGQTGCPPKLVLASNDGGDWTTVEQEPAGYHSAILGRLAATEDAFYHVSGMREVVFTSSDARGRAWSPPQVLAETTAPLDVLPAIGADGDNVSVMWRDVPAGTNQPDLFALHSSDGGNTWSEPIRVTTTAFQELPASLVAQGSTVVASWYLATGDMSGELYVARSTDGGRTWSTPQSIYSFARSPHVGLDNPRPVVIAIDEGSGFEIFTFDRPAPGEIESLRFASMDGGAWTRASAPSPFRTRIRSAASAGGTTHVVTSTYGEEPETYYSKWIPAPSEEPGQARAIDHSCPEARVPNAGFSDTSGNSHEKAINCAVWWEVANGTTESTYSPATAVNRAQMASFISRLIDNSGGSLPAPTRDHFFDDNGSPHEPAINRLAEAGIVGGVGEGRYAPNNEVRRDQMATFLVRAYEYRAQTTLTAARDYFADDQGNTHEVRINKAAEAGFTGGTGSGYQPGKSVRRDQMASFLMRVLDLLVQGGHSVTP